MNPDEAYRAGMAALESGEEVAALQLVEAARQRSPSDARLWHVGGLLHRALGDLAPALVCCDRAAALAPRDFGTLHLRARVTFEAGLPATSLYEQVLRIEQRDSARLGLIEATSRSAARPWPAPGSIGCLWATPNDRGPLLSGPARAAPPRDRRAHRSMERALAQVPRNVVLWRELIVTLIRATRFEDALAAVGRARAAAGPHPVFDSNEGVCADELGDHLRAGRLFAPLADADEVHFIVHRARNALRLGRPEAAAAMLAPKLASDAPDVAPYLATAWRLCDDARWQWLEGDERQIGVYEDRPSSGLADTARRSTQDRRAASTIGRAAPRPRSLLGRIDPAIQSLRRLRSEVARHIAQRRADPDTQLASAAIGGWAWPGPGRCG